MKANNGKGNNPERDEWETPQRLWNKLNEQYNFTFDCCATKDNTKCNSYTNNLFIHRFSLKEGILWMNPPYSMAYQIFRHFYNFAEKGVCIYRCDNMETKIWQEVIFPNASWIFIPNKRIKYEGMEGKGSRFPSALIGYNVDAPNEIQGKLLK